MTQDNFISKKNVLQCTIALLHDTPLPSSKALFEAFHLVNQEWPLTNSGALLQRLKLMGSSQNLNNSARTDNSRSNKTKITNLKGENENENSTETKNATTSSVALQNKPVVQFNFKTLPEDQLPLALPFSVVAYLENKEGNEDDGDVESEQQFKPSIKIIGHSRWALALPVLFNRFSENEDKDRVHQVIMDSLVVDPDYRHFGIGKAILLFGEEILKRMNVNHIFLQTKHAKNFYLKYGYKESKVIPTIKIDKKIFDNIPLEQTEVDKVIEQELKKDSKPRPFNFSQAVWMEKSFTQ